MSSIRVELLDNGAIILTSDSPIAIKPIEDSEPATDSAMQQWQDDMETIWISSYKGVNNEIYSRRVKGLFCTRRYF